MNALRLAPLMTAAVTLLVVALLEAGTAGDAWAQDRRVSTLIDRVDRLQRELVTLQRQVYRGEPPKELAPLPASPTPTGETPLARLELKLTALENQMRSLTGQVEEATYRNELLRRQLEEQNARFEARLARLEQGGAAMLGAAGDGATMASSGDQPPAAPAATGTSQDLASAPRTLGTVSAQDVAAVRAGQGQGTTVPGQTQTAAAAAGAEALPEGTPQSQYNYAFGLLSQANYDEAERALSSFVEQYPEDPLAGNAKYWLGETYYVRGAYQQAAITFAEGYQRYPNSAKAPDNLLKLGMSLSALGSKNDACGTYAELMKRYPDAGPTVLGRANQERQRLGCN